MLGVALNAQRAGWGTGAPAANFVGISKLGYENRQSPAFSYKISGSSRPEWNLEETAIANIDNTVYADNKGFVFATTFYMDWNESTLDPQDENTVYGFLHDIRIKTSSYSGFNSINMFLQLRNGRLNITSRFETDSTIRRVTKDLPGEWQDYNNRWMTLIFVSSENPATFVNYAPSEGTAGFGSWNTRSSLFDTETGAVIQTIDFVPQGLDFPGLAEWPQFQGDAVPVPFNTSGTNGIRVQGNIDAFMQPGEQPYRLANLWGTLGRSFDPVQHGSNLLTVRPSAVINDATAWYNIQFADFVTASGSIPYHIAPVSGASFMSSPSNGRALDLTYGSNASEFNAGYSTTIIPRDRNI